MSGTRFYKIWKGLFTRCYNKNYRLYKDYGGRGIRVSKEWHMFENFRDDMIPTYNINLSIDRKDNNKGYSKENCKWSTQEEQNKNKRMQKLDIQKIYDIRKRYEYGNGRLLAKEYGVNPAVISEVVNKKRNYANY